MKTGRICIAIFLYSFILVMNLMGVSRTACDWGNHVFVFACFVFCAIDWKKTRDNMLLAFMFFTLIADVLSGFSETFALSVIFFFVSQIIMSQIIWKRSGTGKGLLLRVLLTIVGLAGITAAGLLNPFYAFGVVYFMWFVANTVQAIMARQWENYILRGAMGLYLIGDICLITNLLIPEGGLLKTILTYGTWMPYLPAVFLIASSSRESSSNRPV